MQQILESQFLIEEKHRIPSPSGIALNYSNLFKKLQSVDYNPNSVECEKFKIETKKVLSSLTNSQKRNSAELTKANRTRALNYQRIISENLASTSTNNDIPFSSKTLLSSNYSFVLPVSPNIDAEVL